VVVPGDSDDDCCPWFKFQSHTARHIETMTTHVSANNDTSYARPSLMSHTDYHEAIPTCF